jgi:hypothetical protein
MPMTPLLGDIDPQTVRSVVEKHLPPRGVNYSNRSSAVIAS